MMKAALEILKHSNNPTRSIHRNISVFKQLMEVLDNPYKHFKSIHITGTNGKGSVSLKIAAALQAQGIRTGLYTSPHLFSFRERIQINQSKIDLDYFAASIQMIHNVSEKHSLQLSFFQYLTAVSFLYFRDQKCEYAAIEVGLGGRHDTTNVITPVLSIITSIGARQSIQLGIDHTRLLGSTRHQIAKDKAGIIKDFVPVLVGPHAQLECIQEQALMKNAPLFAIKQHYDNFQAQNNAVVAQAIKIINKSGINISQNSIKIGCNTRQLCRMEQLPLKYYTQKIKPKKIIFDVGHNPSAISHALKYYQTKIKKSQNDKLCVIFGASKQKEVDESLSNFLKQTQNVYLVTANHFRAMPIQSFPSNITIKCKIVEKGNIFHTMEEVMKQNYDCVLIIGSFYIMPEAWGFFNPQFYQNNESINEMYNLLKP